MNLASVLRLPGLRALAGLVAISVTGACTYDFDQFEGLAPPASDDAGQSGRAGSGGGKDASVPDGGGGRSGSGATGGTAGRGGSSGSGGSGGSTGGAGGNGGATGGSGGAGATGGAGGSAGSGGAAGSTGKGGASGAAGATGSGGSSGSAPDASIDAAGGSGGATGGAGGATGGSGGATAGSGGTTAGSGGGGAAGTAGSAGTSIADASDVTRPPDASPDRSADVTTDAAFDCSAVSGTVFQGHCYYTRSVAVDWNTANTTTCEAPAHLVTINSAAEQSLVAGLLSTQDRWIGLRRPTNSPKAESSFYWVTNEPLSYRSWDVYSDADKEPNYTGECVRMRFTGMWADVACTEALAVVCERE
jgi:hypothetical protein